MQLNEDWKKVITLQAIWNIQLLPKPFINVNKAAKKCLHTHTHRSLNSRQPWGSKSTWHNAVYKRWQILTSHGLWGQMELNQHLFGLTGGMHSDLAEEYLTGSALPLNLNLSIHFLLSYAILLYPPVQTPKSVFPLTLEICFTLFLIPVLPWNTECAKSVVLCHLY